MPFFEKITNPTSEQSEAQIPKDKKSEKNENQSKTSNECTNSKTEDNDTSLLLDMILARFGVAVGSSRVRDPKNKEIVEIYLANKRAKEKLTEKPWTFDAAKHLYRTYQKVPQAALDMVVCVVTFNTNVIVTLNNIALDAETDNQSSIYKIDYNDKNIEKTVGELNKSESDSFTASHNAFDHATLHELGHIVDRKYGFSSKYGGWDYRELSGWEEYDTNKEDEVTSLLKYYLDNITEKKDFTDNEINIMIQLGMTIVRSPNITIGDIAIKLSEMCTKEDLNINQRKIIKSNYINGLVDSFADLNPWKSPKNGVKNVNIFQAYNKEDLWYSYSIEKTKDSKVSIYQLRCPSDDFAESFATYYNNKSKSNDAIKSSPYKKYLDWIHKNVDPILRGDL